MINSLLIKTVKAGNLELVKFLVSKGADIHVENDYALRCAACRGQLEIVKFLISKGVDVHARGDETLFWATGNRHLEVVEFLKSL